LTMDDLTAALNEYGIPASRCVLKELCAKFLFHFLPQSSLLFVMPPCDAALRLLLLYWKFEGCLWSV
jgi:hypothetical protein